MSATQYRFLIVPPTGKGKGSPFLYPHCGSSVAAHYHRKEKGTGRKKALITASGKMPAVIFAPLRDQRPLAV
ncbi:MAG: hypothetical protein LBP82_00435 [Candidatus Methanoplasma sp.]|nr:hypothetical protein [Candidatus Methanoplasma sp.]